MVLETLQPGATTNVRGLTIESPRQTPNNHFDLEQDMPAPLKTLICSSARQQLVESGQMPEEESWLNYTGLADAKMLYPHELADISLTDRQARLWVRTHRSFLIASWGEIRALNRTLKNPFRESELANAADRIRDAVEPVDPKESSVFIADAGEATILSLKICSPEKIANLKPSPKYLEISREHINQKFDKRLFAGMASGQRILFWPDEPPVVPTEEDWAQMKTVFKTLCQEALETGRRLEIHKIVNLARSMQILAADELKITENGVEPIFRNKLQFQTPTQPLPETRRF